MTKIFYSGAGSEWFSWFNEDDSSQMVALNQTQLYKQDWIGLKALDQVTISDKFI